MFIGIEICDFLHSCNQLRTMTVKCHNIGLMGGEFVTDKYLTPARFIQDRYLYAVTELGQPVYKNDVYILDKIIMSYFIIFNIVLDILNSAVIAHRHIMKRHVSQTGVFLYSARQGKLRVEYTQTHFTRETGMMYKFR